MCSVTQSCPALCNSMDCTPPGSSVPEDSPGKNTEVDCHALLQGIFPGSSDGKKPACNAGDLSSILGLGRSPGGGHDNPLQYSCLENPMNIGAWWATVHGAAKSWT